MLVRGIVWHLILNALLISGQQNDVSPANNQPTQPALRTDVVKYLIKKVLNDLNVNENVVIAPHAAQNLVNELLERNVLDSSSTDTYPSLSTDTENDNEINARGLASMQATIDSHGSPTGTTPIQVTNKLQIAEFQNPNNNINNNRTTTEQLQIVNEKLLKLEKQLAKIAMQSWTTTNNGTTKSSLKLELINDVTLNARWAFNFQKRDTHKRLFYPPHQEEHTYLDAMRKDDIFNYGIIEMGGYNVSALELGLYPPDYKVVFLLPQAGQLVHSAQYLSENLHLLLDEMALRQYLHPRLVRVILPKFQLTHKLNLKHVFEQLQIEDLTSMVNIAQRSHININERGIGKLERTTVLFWNAFSSFRTSPIIFEVNRPFLFFVYNAEGIQLFGYLNKLN